MVNSVGGGRYHLEYQTTLFNTAISEHTFFAYLIYICYIMLFCSQISLTEAIANQNEPTRKESETLIDALKCKICNSHMVRFIMVNVWLKLSLFLQKTLKIWIVFRMMHNKTWSIKKILFNEISLLIIHNKNVSNSFRCQFLIQAVRKKESVRSIC